MPPRREPRGQKIGGVQAKHFSHLKGSHAPMPAILQTIA